MSVMFHDIHCNIGGDMIEDRIPGVNFEEVLYADDTICISSSTRKMNKLIAEIEREGLKFGLKLNKGKCETMYTMEEADVHFENGETWKGKQ